MAQGLLALGFLMAPKGLPDRGLSPVMPGNPEINPLAQVYPVLSLLELAGISDPAIG